MPSLLLSGTYYYPDYSPDGAKIVCSGYADNLPARIFVVNINGTGLMPLTDSGGSYYPAWSPNGTQITYSFDDVGGSSNEDIYVIDLLQKWHR